MAKIADANFKGKEGSYGFEVYSLDSTFESVGAVYIFTKRVVDPYGKGKHTFVYIGQTDSLADRIPNHEKWPCFKRYNANCICVHLDNNEQSRRKIEADLIAANDAPCNKE